MFKKQHHNISVFYFDVTEIAVTLININVNNKPVRQTKSL
jgi:hypothetical protein